MNPRAASLILLLAVGCDATTSTDAGADSGADVGADSGIDVGADVGNDAASEVGVDAPSSCDFSVVYTFGPNGGLTPVRETMQLEPGRRFTYTRTPFSSADAGPCMCSCSTTLADCGAPDGGPAGTRAVLDAFADPEVTAGFGDQVDTLYGRDTRPVDGQVFVVTRGDGRHFEVGADCAGATGCRAIPAGLARLRAVLTVLQAQELARPACAGVES